jgi:hypothetical protein
MICQRRRLRSRKDKKPPSPLNQPLTFFDPDTDLGTTDVRFSPSHGFCNHFHRSPQPGSSRPVYRSALGELLSGRAAPISQHSNQASPIDTTIYEPVETTLKQHPSLASSTTPQSQPQIRIKQQLQTNRTRQDTLFPREWPSASFQRQPDQGASSTSTHFPTSSFSFRAPNLENHPVNGVHRDDRDPRSPPAGYISESRGAAQSIPSSTQATGPKRPSMWHSVSQGLCFYGA